MDLTWLCGLSLSTGDRLLSVRSRLLIMSFTSSVRECFFVCFHLFLKFCLSDLSIVTHTESVYASWEELYLPGGSPRASSKTVPRRLWGRFLVWRCLCLASRQPSLGSCACGASFSTLFLSPLSLPCKKREVVSSGQIHSYDLCLSTGIVILPNVIIGIFRFKATIVLFLLLVTTILLRFLYVIAFILD